MEQSTRNLVVRDFRPEKNKFIKIHKQMIVV